MKMKNNNKTEMMDLTEAKDLLKLVEGGLGKSGGDALVPPCDLWNCLQPLYGVVLDPLDM